MMDSWISQRVRDRMRALDAVLRQQPTFLNRPDLPGNKENTAMLSVNEILSARRFERILEFEPERTDGEAVSTEEAADEGRILVPTTAAYDREPECEEC